MPGLVPGIHVFLAAAQDVDGGVPATPRASPGFQYLSAEALAKAGKPGHNE
jgi:hypothetical protein